MRFVLFHGAWCWTKVVPEIEKLGHEAIAIDLPGHASRRDEIVTLATRTDAILGVLEPGDVLVGHSGGGYDITLAADAAPDLVGHLIYLAAALPIEGRPLIDASGGRPAAEADDGGTTQLMTDETGMSRFVRMTSNGYMECYDFDAARAFFYHDCSEADARWAFDQLTPAPTGFIQEPVHLARFWQAALPRSYIRCRQDRAAPRSLTDTIVHRLGVDAFEIDASHSPFLSKPDELAEMFVAATRRVPVGPLSPT